VNCQEMLWKQTEAHKSVSIVAPVAAHSVSFSVPGSLLCPNLRPLRWVSRNTAHVPNRSLGLCLSTLYSCLQISNILLQPAVPKCINHQPHSAFEPFPKRIYLFWGQCEQHGQRVISEHCTVCGFSEPMVFTKTVWTKFSTVRYWPSCCTASVLQQTTANLTGFSTDVENCIAVSS